MRIVHAQEFRMFALWLVTTVACSVLTLIALDYRRSNGRGALA